MPAGVLTLVLFVKSMMSAMATGLHIEAFAMMRSQEVYMSIATGLAGIIRCAVRFASSMQMPMRRALEYMENRLGRRRLIVMIPLGLVDVLSEGRPEALKGQLNLTDLAVLIS